MNKANEKMLKLKSENFMLEKSPEKISKIIADDNVSKNSPEKRSKKFTDINSLINSPKQKTKKFAEENLFSNYTNDTVSVIGLAVKEGQKLTGVELSPSMFRSCGLLNVIKELGWNIRDQGDITTQDLQEKIAETQADETEYKYVVENAHVIGPMCHQLHEIVYRGSQRQDFNLILGGDHGLAAGSISGMLKTYPDLKVVWIDAHGDCNTPETSPSGNYHGMPVAHLLGWIKKGDVKGFNWLYDTPFLKPENIVYIGLRDIDAEEKKLLKKHNIKCYSPFDIEFAGGMGNVMKETLEYLKCDGKTPETTNPIHCSWDVDGCDPSFMTGTGTRSRCGLTLRESHFILQTLYNTKNLVSLDMVEVNTLLETSTENREMLHGDIPELIGQQTILYAAELILSALGFSWL
jgi:arginase